MDLLRIYAFLETTRGIVIHRGAVALEAGLHRVVEHLPASASPCFRVNQLSEGGAK